MVRNEIFGAARRELIGDRHESVRATDGETGRFAVFEDEEATFTVFVVRGRFV